MTDKKVSDELAELTEAVRELKDREVADTIRELRAEIEKLRAERAGHHCHGCSCTHIHWHYPATWTVPGTITYPNYVVTSGTNTITTTNAAAGVGSTYTLSLGN
jgi:hypothetical protein